MHSPDAGAPDSIGPGKVPQVVMCPPPSADTAMRPDLAGLPTCIPWIAPANGGGLEPPPMIEPDAGPSPTVRADFRPEITCGTAGLYNTTTTTEPYPYLGLNYDSTVWNNNEENTDSLGYIRAQGTYACGAVSTTGNDQGPTVAEPPGANPAVPVTYIGPWWGSAFVGFMVSPVAPCAPLPANGGVEVTSSYVATLSVNLNLEYNHQTYGMNGAFLGQCEASYGQIEVTVYDMTQGTPEFGWVMLDTTRGVWDDEVCGIGQNLQKATTTPVPYNISGNYTNFVAMLGHTYQVFVAAETMTTDYQYQFDACAQSVGTDQNNPCYNVDWLQAQVVNVAIESTPIQATALPVGPTSSN